MGNRSQILFYWENDLQSVADRISFYGPKEKTNDSILAGALRSAIRYMTALMQYFGHMT
jgi:hypothetical protein